MLGALVGRARLNGDGVKLLWYSAFSEASRTDFQLISVSYLAVIGGLSLTPPAESQDQQPIVLEQVARP
jgi:hypothetical protein